MNPQDLNLGKPTYHCYADDTGEHIFMFEDDASGALLAIIHADRYRCYGEVFYRGLDDKQCKRYQLDVPASIRAFTESTIFLAEVQNTSAYVAHRDQFAVYVDREGRGETAYSVY